MKTRIKIFRDNRGRAEYLPQYKKLFWWKCFETLNYAGGDPIVFYSLEDAKDYLDYTTEPTKKSVSYLTYP